ncbi:MAG: multicopper oxidase domain-containing protein, partial [Plesiomonas shigelloides]
MNIKSIFHRTSATASTQESGTCNLTRRKLLGVTGAMLAAQPLLVLSSSVRAACMPSSAPEGEGKAAIPTPLSGHYPWQQFNLDIAYGPKMPQGCQLIQINDQPCGPEIRLKKGDIFYTTVRNRMKEPTTVHWHGILVPNLMDGVPNVSQVPLPQGVETTYSWPVVQGGTYWYHSHFGLQDQQGLAGPLILEDPDEPFVYDKEAVLFMEDRLSADPYQVLDALQHKPAPEAAIAPTLPP